MTIIVYIITLPVYIIISPVNIIVSPVIIIVSPVCIISLIIYRLIKVESLFIIGFMIAFDFILYGLYLAG